jgi:hypothetical protein
MKKRGDVRISARDTLKTLGFEWLADILFPEGG